MVAITSVVELAQDAPGLELGVSALAGSAWSGMSPVGLLLGGGLVPSPARNADVLLAEAALMPSTTRHAPAVLKDLI